MNPFVMEDYATLHREHCLTVPQTFNFGCDVVDAWAGDADKTALIWCDSSGSERLFTFSDISQRSNQVANWLTEQGICKGERIVVMLPRIPEWQITLVGCLKVGAIPIPCITMLTEKSKYGHQSHDHSRQQRPPSLDSSTKSAHWPIPADP